MRCGWVFISARAVENCISVERLNTLNTDLHPVLQKIKKLQPVKQDLLSLLPESAVHINFAVNLARFFKTPILYYIDNHIQNRSSKKSRKIHGKTPVLESLLIKLRSQACNFIKKTLQHWCFPANFEKFLRTPFLKNTFGRRVK